MQTLNDNISKRKNQEVFFVLMAFLIAIISIGALLNYLFKDSNTDKTIGRQEMVIDQLQAQQESMKAAAELKASSEKLTVGLIASSDEEKKKVSRQNSASHAQTEERVNTIKKDYDTRLTQTAEPQETLRLIKQREAAVSRARVSALWANFCKRDNSQECKAYNP